MRVVVDTLRDHVDVMGLGRGCETRGVDLTMNGDGSPLTLSGHAVTGSLRWARRAPPVAACPAPRPGLPRVHPGWSRACGWAGGWVGSAPKPATAPTSEVDADPGVCTRGNGRVSMASVPG
ncbi:hypothetical protein GCM10023320_54210 [Pseudonocardia adelaidensis]|uniref:Uncharacterized protein n=1 Tax=Pseudonocardia adelaidensis TaxID=648754 RepID=A0ABP9NTM1_9PSEU